MGKKRGKAYRVDVDQHAPIVLLGESLLTVMKTGSGNALLGINKEQ